jgi:D-alanine-D-alanine ligase
MNEKKRIGLIFGGRSAEHEVSLASAPSVMQHLDPQRYEIVPILITPEGTWLWGIEPRALLESEITPAMRAEAVAVTLSADPHCQRVLALEAGTSLPHNGALDVLFPVLHGPNGEDGTIQGLFELTNIPYVGCGVLASAVGMDKAIMKQLFREAALPITDFLCFRSHEWKQTSQSVLDAIEAQIPYPCFVKPANLGSSIGVSKAVNRQQLARAIEVALSYDRKVVVERGLTCREFSCAILGNDELCASVVGEILPGSEFSDYNDKYINHTIQFIIPADLSEDRVQTLRAMALRVYRLLDLSGLARVDFFIDRTAEQIYLNEVNTMPGFTSMSLYPQLWQASGLGYPQLLDRLIELALQRHETRH